MLRSPTTTQAVEVDNLSMRYGKTQAVDGLNLSIEIGSIVAVLGPNGAGKTTTLETCEGFRKPQGGQVRVFGLDPIADARVLRPRVGVMLQNGGAWSGSRCHEMLQHMASLHAHPLPVDALIERLGLGSFGKTPYRRMSGGQQQRLNLAMAIVGRPELVFLDEPTAGLDPQARRATWELVRDLRDNGVTVVLTTHFMDEAEQLADRIHIIDEGKVIAAGTGAELTAADAADVLRFTTVSAVNLQSLTDALPAGAQAREDEPGSYVVSGVRSNLLVAFTAWCGANAVLPDTMAIQRRTLEDVFLELTGKDLR